MIGSAIWKNDFFGPSEAVQVGIRSKYTLLVLWGGEDISPSLYGQYPYKTNASHRPSPRDRIEQELIQQAVKIGIPILGICRGHQLLAAVAGAQLYQHVDNHDRGHHDLTYEGETLQTNSCHHQMVIPNEKVKVLAWSPCLSPKKYHGSDEVEDAGPEPEIIHIPELKAIGVQGHPEWMPKDSRFNQLVRQLVKEKLGVYL